MIRPEFDISPEQIADFCRRHHIRWLAVFGSALRDDFGPESDLDVLIEFEPGKTPGLAFFAMQDELSDLVGGRPVDLATVKELNRWIRGPVLREARVLWSQDEDDGPRTCRLSTRSPRGLIRPDSRKDTPSRRAVTFCTLATCSIPPGRFRIFSSGSIKSGLTGTRCSNWR
ncbi:MAG: uncharacterized protein QOF33_2745 [Thermomicrobiales bacterium]|nr:uncharacterized protein [Thermomicrobiales bacterium]